MLGGDMRDAVKMARKAIKRKRAGKKSRNAERRASVLDRIGELMRTEGISKKEIASGRKLRKTSGRKRPTTKSGSNAIIKRGKKGDGVDMKRVKKAADSLRMMGGGKVHGDKKKKDMMYGGEMKKKKGMMGGGKVYTSMDKKYGGGIFPRKGKM